MVHPSRRRLLAACMLILAAAPARARPLDAVTASGDLRVALYGDNAPFSADVDGKPHGIDVDIAQGIADALKLRLDLRLVDAGENVDGDFRLSLWKGDLAGTPLADLMLHVPHDRLLATRNEQIFLTTPYFDQHLVFAYRKGKLEGLETVADLADHPVAVEGASASDMMLLSAENGRFRNNLKHYKSFDDAAKAYLAGEIPVLAGTPVGDRGGVVRGQGIARRESDRRIGGARHGQDPLGAWRRGPHGFAGPCLRRRRRAVGDVRIRPAQGHLRHVRRHLRGAEGILSRAAAALDIRRIPYALEGLEMGHACRAGLHTVRMKLGRARNARFGSFPRSRHRPGPS